MRVGVTGPRRRIAYVDGLRAVAVLSVVATHSFSSVTIGQSFGVDLFFVISGFCLAYPTLARVYERGSAAFDIYGYAARRVVRIVPPYYIAIVVMLVGAAVFVPGLNRVSAIDVARQALFMEKGANLLAASFWSLAVEFRWYFLFPIALWLWTKSPRAFIASTFAIAIAASMTMAYSTDLFVLPAFLLGIVAADIDIRGHRAARFAAPACVIMIVLAYLKSGTLISPLWEMGVFFLVVAAGSSPWLRRPLSMRWLTAVGVASYSIYLMQGPVIASLQTERLAPWVLAICAVSAGFAFWFIAERPFVETSLRNRLVAEFEQAFAKWLPRIDIGRTMPLSATPAVARVNGRVSSVDIPSKAPRAHFSKVTLPSQAVLTADTPD